MPGFSKTCHCSTDLGRPELVGSSHEALITDGNCGDE
jgi:hypothetical protein